MNVYMTEEEQIELIKKWWSKYGNMLLTALIIGLLCVSAFRWWQTYQNKINAQASTSYENLVQSLANDDNSGVAAQTNNLRANFPKTVYADAAALTQAKVDVRQGHLNEALEQLNWVITQKRVPALVQVARLRAARIKAAQQDYPAALALLEKIDDKAYMPSIYEVRGDIYFASGNKKDAQTNYTQAVKAFPTADMASPLLLMKLNDLAEPQGKIEKQTT